MSISFLSNNTFQKQVNLSKPQLMTLSSALVASDDQWLLCLNSDSGETATRNDAAAWICKCSRVPESNIPGGQATEIHTLGFSQVCKKVVLKKLFWNGFSSILQMCNVCSKRFMISLIKTESMTVQPNLFCMSGSGSKSANVLAVLGGVASDVLDLTGFYYSGKAPVSRRKPQPTLITATPA